MLRKTVLALIVGIVVFLACLLVGGLLATIPVPFVVTVGTFLKTWASVFGLLAALWYFFTNGAKVA